MKSKIFFIFLLAQSYFVTSTANTPPTVKTQLENLNKYWAFNNYDFPILNEKKWLKTDVELIQMHLTLVEKHLRSKNLSLTPKQQENRTKCLDILHEYCKRGVFPKNLYHKNRTPYFIDDFGTACAVGQLIISTGHENLAHKISKENNYAYIEEMNYPALASWATNYGFEIDELKWIQPSYCNDTTCVSGFNRLVTSCFGKNDGCIGNVPKSTFTGLISTSFYAFDEIKNSWFDRLPCQLPAGKYKYQIKNIEGQIEEFFYEVTRPDSISETTTIIHDKGNCQGSISVQAKGGTAPYSYLWLHDNSTSPTLSGLCKGEYSVVIRDNKVCSKLYSFTIDDLSDVKEVENSQFSIYPNPSTNKISVGLGTANSKHYNVLIYNLEAKVIYKGNALTSNFDIDISTFNDGLYLLSVETETALIMNRFIKTSH